MKTYKRKFKSYTEMKLDRGTLYFTEGEECITSEVDSDGYVTVFSIEWFKAHINLFTDAEECTSEERITGSCPCLYLETPCNDMCPCVNLFSSGPCYYCCKHGSLEQRKNQAKWIAEAIQAKRLSKVITEKIDREEKNDV